MKIKFYSKFILASLLCCIAVVFTSCDDIFASEDNPIASYLSMSDKDVTIKIGDTYKRTAIAVSGAVIEYSSSDETVATVDNDGKVTGISVGDATITATATGYNTSGKKIYLAESKTYNVKVNPILAQSVTLSDPSINLLIGKTATLTATVAPDNTTDKTVLWSSDNEAVATVDAEGLITGVAAGTAKITATAKSDNNVKATCTVHVGLLTGVFTINATGGKIQFAQGNLQATTTDLGVHWSWGFAANQWDYAGAATANNKINGNGTVSQNGTVSLFGWVGESSNFGGTTAPYADLGTTANAAMYGITNTVTPDDYGNADNQNLKSDWGNTIGTGWRTLTMDEWTYLFNTRTTGGTVFGEDNARYAHAEINTGVTSIKGMIIFPDGVEIDASEVNTAGTVNGTSDWGTKCTTDQWTNLAAKGCVFLPAAGHRKYYSSAPGYISLEGVNERAYYWTSTGHNASGAQFIEIKSGTLNPGSWNSRINGYAVRLVYPAQ